MYLEPKAKHRAKIGIVCRSEMKVNVVDCRRRGKKGSRPFKKNGRLGRNSKINVKKNERAGAQHTCKGSRNLAHAHTSSTALEGVVKGFVDDTITG